MLSDDFVLEMLKNKKNGYYVELGAADPISGSNTYKLEKDFGWTGVSFDLDETHSTKFNEIRSNPCLAEDAITFNYAEYFEKNNFPKRIDYLQVDVDTGYTEGGRPLGNPGSNLLGLIALPLNTYRFSVITFEHDALIHYKLNSVRDAQREILDSLGYALVKRIAWEDWWVDPEVVPYLDYREQLQIDAP
jgi:hypothetical protein